MKLELQSCCRNGFKEKVEKILGIRSLSWVSGSDSLVAEKSSQ